MTNQIYKILTLGSLVFISIILIQSCAKHYQPDYIIYYNVSNKTDSEIDVHFSILFTHNSWQVHDSIISILPGAYGTLLVSLHHQRHYFYDSNPESLDTMKRITEIEIYKYDTIKSNKNYRLTKYWVYSKLDDDRAVLNLDVKPEDF